jgi:hypothetical protein
MQANELRFGNPNRSHLVYLKTENYLDSLLPELSSFPPPENDSQQAYQEIHQIIEYTSFLEKDEQLRRRYELYDNDFENYIIERLVNAGANKEDVEKIVRELHDDIIPLIVKLKFAYNRVRPYQLSFFKGLKLYPFKSFVADSPAYPSGHAYQAKIYAEVLGNMYPKFYNALNELANDIAWSRLYLGVHYPTDMEYALYSAEVVLKHPEFRKKYKL